jgi:hypothetical protein
VIILIAESISIPNKIIKKYRIEGREKEERKKEIKKAKKIWKEKIFINGEPFFPSNSL